MGCTEAMVGPGECTSEALLPGEMHTLSEEQAYLTDRWIRPNLSAFEALLLRLRDECDRYHEKQRLFAASDAGSALKLPRRASAYPKGYCFEIAVFVARRLLQAKKSINFLQQFRAAGGKITRVWGSLRNEYFQNAIQIGTIYADVANDSVDQRKDKLDIKDFAEAQFGNLRSYEEFSALACRYWGCTLYPNYYFPQLMSYFPLLSINSQGVIKLESTAPYLVGLNVRNNLLLAEQCLFDESESRIVDSEVLAAINRFRQARGLATVGPDIDVQALQQLVAAHRTLLPTRGPGLVNELLTIGSTASFML